MSRYYEVFYFYAALSLSFSPFISFCFSARLAVSLLACPSLSLSSSSSICLSLSSSFFSIRLQNFHSSHFHFLILNTEHSYSCYDTFIYTAMWHTYRCCQCWFGSKTAHYLGDPRSVLSFCHLLFWPHHVLTSRRTIECLHITMHNRMSWHLM